MTFNFVTRFAEGKWGTVDVDFVLPPEGKKLQQENLVVFFYDDIPLEYQESLESALVEYFCYDLGKMLGFVEANKHWDCSNIWPIPKESPRLDSDAFPEQNPNRKNKKIRKAAA